MAIGNMGRFRIPGMMEDINIEEIISRSKRAPTKPKSRKVKPKKKPATSNRKVSLSTSDRAKVASKSKSTKPSGFMAKPKPKPKMPKMPIRPNMRGGRFGLMEDSGLAPVSKKKAVAVKPKPQFKPKVTPRPSSVKVPTRPKVSGEELIKVGSETKGRPNIPNVGISGLIPGANLNIQEIIKQATQGGSTAPAQQTQTGSQETTKKRPNSFDKFFEGSMDGTTDRNISEMTWEEIDKEMNDIRFANRNTWGGGSRGMPDRYEELKARYESVAPISELEAAYDRAGYNRYKSGDNVGEGYLEEGERLKKLIESRRGSQDSQQPSSNDPFSKENSTRTFSEEELERASAADKDASTMKTLEEFFEKMKSQQEQQQPQQPQIPKRPEIQQWDIMGQQQPTGPIVAPGFPSGPGKGPFMPSPMPPQMPSQMFGGYGGTAPIVPAMAYAGMGNFPQPPRMIAPFDPDAEPGGPPMPTGPVFT